MKLMHELAAPFRLEGKGENKGTACLLIHGFTGSPAHHKELAHRLNDEGFTVEVIRLKGHGTTPEEMEATTRDDWYNTARDAYLKLREEFKGVNIVGFSMGGLLTLSLAQEFQDMNKIVAIATPFRFVNPLIPWTPILQYFKRFNPLAPPEPDEGENTEWDIGYRKVPLKSFPHLLKLKSRVEKNLKKVIVPILIIVSKKDNQVKIESGDILYNAVSSADKKILRLENSKHMSILGIERGLIFEEIIRFFKG